MNIKRIIYRITYLWVELFELIINLAKRLVIPGFDGLSLYDVSAFFFKRFWLSSITNRAAALSFTFFLALFPAIIFFFTMIPYIPVHGFQDTLMTLLKNVLPKDSYEIALNTLTDIIKRQHGGFLSFGFIAALYFSTSGISGIMNAFNLSVHVSETRSFFKQKLIAIILILILSVLIVIAISLVIAGTSFIQLMIKEDIIHGSFSLYLLIICKWIIVVALFFFIISFLYYLGPAYHERFRFISAGSTLATFLFILTSVGFNFYISHFSQYNKLYGSIGALIIILMWIYINAIVLLIGFELNASIIRAKQKKME